MSRTAQTAPAPGPEPGPVVEPGPGDEWEPEVPSDPIMFSWGTDVLDPDEDIEELDDLDGYELGTDPGWQLTVANWLDPARPVEPGPGPEVAAEPEPEPDAPLPAYSSPLAVIASPLPVLATPRVPAGEPDPNPVPVAEPRPVPEPATIAAPKPAVAPARSRRRAAVVVVAVAAGAAGATNLISGGDARPSPQRPAGAAAITAPADNGCLREWNTTTSAEAAQLRVTLGQFEGALARVGRVEPLPGTLMAPGSCGLTVYEPPTDTHAVFVSGVKGELGYLDVTSYPRASRYGWPKSARDANVAIMADGSIRAL